jgi:rRNA maturation endonuclease Nob1
MDTVMMDLHGDPADRETPVMDGRRRCGRTFTPYDAMECATCGAVVGAKCREGLSR